MYGKTSERRSTTAKDPAAGDDAEEKPKKRKRNGQTGHGPTPQPDLPTEDVEHDLSEERRVCGAYGGQLASMGTAEESELIAIEERKVVLQRHLQAEYSCPCCRKGVVVAPGPVKLLPGGRYALNFAVAVAFWKYFAPVPLDRQVHIFKH